MRWIGVAVVGLLLAGCIGDHLVQCEDGTACPVGYACSNFAGCIGPDQTAACAGLAEGDACTVPNVGTGQCVTGVCIVPVCGNGRVEASEACDDGNTVPSDGCNATCSSTGACGNGVTDPGEECDCGDGASPLGAGCTEPNDASASSATSRCRGDCKLVRCGNGLHDFGEACDDGNLVPGDGCVPDCSSTETCGNGVLDFFVSEQCDDGNLRNHDGCDKGCRVEQTVWRQRAIAPTPRHELASAYDAIRSRTVVFGGWDVNGIVLGDTWEWTGTGWLAVSPSAPAAAPSPRHGHAMAYDAVRHRVVLFGGTNATQTGYPNDTWEWDGQTWTKRMPAHAPPGRQHAAMAYDVERKMIVMFGGRSSSSVLNAFDETWLWDGNDWTLATPAMSPGGRSMHGLAYDPTQAKMIMFGGVLSTGATTNDTWEWTGSTWNLLMAASATPVKAVQPTNRSLVALAFDHRRGQVVLFGGLVSGGAIGETRVWTGAAWTQVTTTQPITNTWYAHTMTFHAASGQLVVFGGRNGPTFLATVMALDGSDRTVLPTNAWAQLPDPSVVFPKRDEAVMAFDAARSRAIVYGGEDQTGLPVDDTWSWDGANWFPVASGTPSARVGATMAYDPDASKLVLFSGFDYISGISTQDTWTWNGASWADAMAGQPSGRTHGALACEAGGTLLMFGGDALDTTWRWDGSTWTEVVTTGGPAGQSGHAMAYDSARGQTVMYGSDELWEWSGTAWTERMPAVKPLPRSAHNLIYDPLRGRVTMFGGTMDPIATGCTPTVDCDRRDVWEWNGTAWVDRTPLITSTPARAGYGFAYVPAMHEAIVVAGRTNGNLVDDTWALRWEGTTVDEACRSGIDLDGDGAIGCADDECWGLCDPHCPPHALACAANRPRCGDGTCSTIEDCHLCPQDCPVCTPPVCGDFVCDVPETFATCRNDCPM